MGDVIKFGADFVSPRIRELRRKLPSFRKGLIIGPKLALRPGQLDCAGLQFSNEQLRRAVLFWDRLVSPVNVAIEFADTVEMQFLQQVGFLDKPVFSELSGDLSEIVRRSYLDCYQKLEAENPGTWALASGSDGLDIGSSAFGQTRGAMVSLYNAVPIPSRDVPLEEVLEFKFRRQDEVLSFNDEIDGFYENWVNSSDLEHNLRRAKLRIEKACSDLVRVARENKNPFKRSNWKVSYSLNPIAAYGAYNAIEKIPNLASIPWASEIAALTGAAFTFGRDFGPVSKDIRSSPYLYSVSIDQELGV